LSHSLVCFETEDILENAEENDKAIVDPFHPDQFRVEPPAEVAEELSDETKTRREARAARRRAEFYTVYAEGYAELIRRTNNAKAIAVALEAVRLVATRRSSYFRLTAESSSRWHLSPQERRTVIKVLRGMTDLFQVPKYSGREAATITPTPAAVALLFRGRN